MSDPLNRTTIADNSKSRDKLEELKMDFDIRRLELVTALREIATALEPDETNPRAIDALEHVRDGIDGLVVRYQAIRAHL